MSIDFKEKDILERAIKNDEFNNFLHKLNVKLKTSKKSIDHIKILNLNKFYNNISDGIDIFLFHAVTEKISEIQYKDMGNISIDNFINTKILKLNIQRLLNSKKINRIFLFSNYEADFFNNEKVINIKLEINEKKLMYERVICMYSFVKSKLFLNNTCFVDLDVFIHPEKLTILDNNFDIALTHRSIPGFMPINEGIIFAKKTNKNSVINFFKEYLLIYLSIGSSKEVLDHYNKDVFQWRGGQLSLNLLVYDNGSLYIDYETKLLDKTKILFLPVFYYNFSPKSGDEYSINYLKEKIVIHFKGNLKKEIKFIEKIVSYF